MVLNSHPQGTTTARLFHCPQPNPFAVPWRQQRDLDLRSLFHRVALHLQVQVTADQRQRRLQVLGLHEHQHHVLPWRDGIGMALHVLAEAQGGVLLEVRPGREHVGA